MSPAWALSEPPKTENPEDAKVAIDGIQVVEVREETGKAGTGKAETGTAGTEQGTDGPEPCAGGVIRDDGATDYGYSFVPSSTEAYYVQRFERQDFPRATLDTACVCFFQKPPGGSADVKVVFFADAGGQPGDQPFAAVPGTVDQLGGRGKDSRLYEIDLGAVVLPEGTTTFWAGVSWNPSAERSLFSCADRSKGTAIVPGFFKDDIDTQWRAFSATKDPMFKPHRSLLFRLRAAPEGADSKPAEPGAPKPSDVPETLE